MSQALQGGSPSVSSSSCASPERFELNMLFEREKNSSSSSSSSWATWVRDWVISKLFFCPSDVPLFDLAGETPRTLAAVASAKHEGPAATALGAKKLLSFAEELPPVAGEPGAEGPVAGWHRCEARRRGQNSVLASRGVILPAILPATTPLQGSGLPPPPPCPEGLPWAPWPRPRGCSCCEKDRFPGTFGNPPARLVCLPPRKARWTDERRAGSSSFDFRSTSRLN